MTAPHDVPTAGELLDAVREWLEREVVPEVDGRLRFHARVAANVLAIVAREIELGADQERQHRERLTALGMDDEAALATAIRSGELDHRLDEVRSAVRASVVDKLAVANPGYLVGSDRVSDGDP